jgi:hypothetical protein
MVSLGIPHPAGASYLLGDTIRVYMSIRRCDTMPPESRGFSDLLVQITEKLKAIGSLIAPLYIDPSSHGFS